MPNIDDLLEIETIDNPAEELLDTTETDDGGLELTFGEREEDIVEAPTEFEDFNTNIADFIEEDELNKISLFVSNRFDTDMTSNQDFFDNINAGLKTLGLTIEEVSDPFPGATPVSHPLILEAALKTQAKIMGEIFNGKGIVDTYVISDKDETVLDRANRVKNYMDYQYLYQMEEFISDTENMSLRYALTGNAYRKYFFDPIRNRSSSRYIHEDKFIINSEARTLERADFYTELYTLDRHELEHLIELGEFKDVLQDETVFGVNLQGNARPTEVDKEIIVSTGDPLGFTNSAVTADKFQLREHHCYLKLPEPFNEGLKRALPYIVTVEENTQKVLSIRRNWKETDPLKLKRVWYAHYKLIPGLGFHGLGYLHILGNFQFALTQIIRSLIDSGQFSNLQGGFRAKGIRFTKDSTIPLKFGEYREIDTGSRPIKDVLMPLQFNEPSQVLERIVSWLDGRAQKFADATEQVIADSTNYGPVGTTVALLEASTKFTNGILKRFYNSLKEEFKILYALNFDVLDETQDFFIKGNKFNVTREDFSGAVDVQPSADPNLSSSAHRIAVAQTKLSAAQQAPDIHDLRSAYMEFYLQIGMEKDEIDKLLPPKEEAKPLDPLSDIHALASGKPIKAFPGQNHEAHIKFKEAFIGDPKAGASSYAASIIPLLQANIAEHLLMQYTERMTAIMEQQGVPIDLNAIGQGSAQEDPAIDFAIAQAGELLAAFNAEENLKEQAKLNDPATILALSEDRNSRTKEADLEHRKHMDYLEALNADRKLDLQEKDQLIKVAGIQDKHETEMDKERMKLGGDLVRQALIPLQKDSLSDKKK